MITGKAKVCDRKTGECWEVKDGKGTPPIKKEKKNAPNKITNEKSQTGKHQTRDRLGETTQAGGRYRVQYSATSAGQKGETFFEKVRCAIITKICTDAYYPDLHQVNECIHGFKCEIPKPGRQAKSALRI